jgi:hypothetical protein
MFSYIQGWLVEKIAFTAVRVPLIPDPVRRPALFNDGKDGFALTTRRFRPDFESFISPTLFGSDL